MWRDIWAFLGERPEVGFGVSVFAIIVLPLTLAAILLKPPAKPSFTLDWRQRAGFAWGLFFLIGDGLILRNRYLFALGLVAYLSSWAGAPRLIQRLGWMDGNRRRGLLATMVVHALVVLTCLPLVGWALREQWLDWRFERNLRSSVAFGIHMRAAWQGFPAPLDNIKARVLEAERATPDRGWAPLPAQAKCWSFHTPSRAWLVCADPNGQATSLSLDGEPMARDWEAGRLADARRLLWVVTGRGGEADAAEFLKRRTHSIGGIVLNSEARGKFGYRLTARAAPRGP